MWFPVYEIHNPVTNTYYNTHHQVAITILYLKGMHPDRSEKLVRHVVVILTAERRAKELSMNKLAWMAGLSPKAIAFIEQGKNSPTLRNICRLADALELSLPNLFAKAEKEFSNTEGATKDGDSCTAN